MFQLQKLKGLQPTKTWSRPLAVVSDAAANTAYSYAIDLPRDHFIHEITVQVGYGTAAPLFTSLADNLATIQVVGNGNKYLKDMIGGMAVNVQRINGQRHITGYYHLFFTDPKIDEAKPLPAWVFTSLQLKVTTTAPGASQFGSYIVTVVESAYQGEDLSNWKILVEKYLAWVKYGTNTGYQVYEHERAYKIFSYLYVQDDNGTIAAGKFDKLKLLARRPEGELSIQSENPVNTIVAQDNARLAENLDAGYWFLEWAGGFPSTDFSSIKSYLNIPTAGTNIGARVLERYIL